MFVWFASVQYVTVHAKTFRKSAILISSMGFDGHTQKVGNFYCVLVFSLIRCGYHSRTLPPTLDSREMFTSATAALRTPPCLFPYAGAWTDYTVKYAIKLRLQSNSCPLVSRQFPPLLSLYSSFLSTEP